MLSVLNLELASSCQYKKTHTFFGAIRCWPETHMLNGAFIVYLNLHEAAAILMRISYRPLLMYVDGKCHSHAKNAGRLNTVIVTMHLSV